MQERTCPKFANGFETREERTNCYEASHSSHVAAIAEGFARTSGFVARDHVYREENQGRPIVPEVGKRDREASSRNRGSCCRAVGSESMGPSFTLIPTRRARASDP